MTRLRQTFLGAAGACALLAGAATAAPLTLAGTTDLPGYTGDFDHFAIDRAHDRLILAGEEHHELDLFKLSSGALESRLQGYGAPHSPLVLPNRNEVLVVDGEKPSPVLDLDHPEGEAVLRLPRRAPIRSAGMRPRATSGSSPAARTCPRRTAT